MSDIFDHEADALEQLLDGYDDEGGGYGPLPKRCRRCGEYDLHWQWHNGGWRLFDSHYQVHVCGSIAAKSLIRSLLHAT